MPEQLVVATDLRRTFGTGSSSFDALRSATCIVNSGDRIALMGPSGSGKSTLLHLLGGLDEPSDGAGSWPALSDRDSLRPKYVVDVFQGPSLLPPLSVLENVRLPLLLMGERDEIATLRAKAAIARFELMSLVDKLPEEISGGQAQRVALARAITVEPRLILADEPTGQLDSATAATVLDILLSEVSSIGAAIIVSTHDPAVAARLDFIWTMRNGQLFTDESLRTSRASTGQHDTNYLAGIPEDLIKTGLERQQ